MQKIIFNRGPLLYYIKIQSNLHWGIGQQTHFYWSILFQNQEIHYMADTMHPGGRLNKKDGLTRYGNSHVKDKTS